MLYRIKKELRKTNNEFDKPEKRKLAEYPFKISSFVSSPTI